MRWSCWLGGVLLLCGLAPVQSADKEAAWPQFLGPQRNGSSSETGLNVDWKAAPPKVLWKVPLGAGFSSCSVVGNRLYTMAENDKKQYAYCFDADKGTELWKRELGPSYLDQQRQGAGPRTTPTCADGKVYCLLPMGQLLCLQAQDGKVLWEVDGLKVTGAENRSSEKYYWGISSSPLVEGDLVIVQLGGSKDNSLVAFDKHTGKLVWGVGSDGPGYGSAIVVTAHGQRQVVCTTARSLLGVDASQGKLLWRFAFGNEYNCNCATPLWADGLLLCSSAYDTGTAALKLDRDGERWQPAPLWKHKQLQSQFSTGIIHDGYLYGSHGTFSGFALKCLELKTGKVIWSEREPGKAGLLYAQGHLLCLESSGTLYLAEANSEKYVGKGSLPVLGRQTWAAPTLANGRLYVRDMKHLACVDLRAR